MINTLDIFLQPLNSIVLKPVKVVMFSVDALEECADLVRKDGYTSNYDLNGDGYLTSADYDLLYAKFYDKYDTWTAAGKTVDIRALVRMQKYYNGLLPIDTDYDLDNDTQITEQDMIIMRRWLLYGKTEKEVFINA